MNTWLIASNLKTYDSLGAFERFREIYWNEKQVQFEPGDIVYIYIASPISAISIKCQVTTTGVRRHDTDDSKFWVDKEEYLTGLEEYTWMRLRCIAIFNDTQRNKLKGRILKDNGLASGFVLGRQKATDKLISYIQSVESD